jgi:hypothetical protein
MATVPAVPAADGPRDPLIVATRPADTAASPRAVYLGFGVASLSGVATGELPVDALAMMLVAEEQRRAHGAARVVHLVADEHALVNRFARHDDVARAAERLVEQIEAVVAAFGFRAYEVLRASELRDPRHAELHAYAATAGADPYTARQAADVEWALRTHGATVKVGWTMATSANDPPGGFDERYFDEVHAHVFGRRVTAVYTGAGRTLDPDRPRCSPYTMLAGEQRLTLDASREDVELTVSKARMRRHLEPICGRAEEHLGHATGGPLAARLTDVLETIRSAT